HPEAAGQRALSSLQDGFEATCRRYVQGWREWQDKLLALDRPAGSSNLNSYRGSTPGLAAHQAGSFPGAALASLSIPWGFNKGDEDLGGYHLVWPRDLVETAGGFLAAGAVDNAKSTLGYLMSIQEADGHWSQNVWLDGEPYWGGVQMDECAFPILLADMLRRGGKLTATEQDRFLPLIERAPGYLVRKGPGTSQDRWGEDAGHLPFTLAAEDAGVAARPALLERQGGVWGGGGGGEQAGPLGGGRGLFTLYAGGRDCRAARRSRHCGALGTGGGGALSARNRGQLERRDRALDVRHRHNGLREARAQRLLCPHRAAGQLRRGLSARRVRVDQEPTPGRRSPAGGAPDQPRCALARPVWPARRGRSPDRRHGARDRCLAQGRFAARPGLVSLQSRWLRRARRWPALRWNGHRPPVASADRRARPLRACRRAARGGAAAARHARGLGESRRPLARTGLGSNGHTRARALSRAPRGQRNATGLGS